MQRRIKELRKHLHMTQTQFGERVGVKGNTVTGYETGLRNPTDAVIKSICREFGASETWLRTGDGEMFVESPDNVVDAVAEKLDLNDFERMILSAYVQLPKQLRDEFCKCMVYSETVAKNEQRTPFAVRKGHDTELLEEAKTRVKKVPGSDLE